MSRILKILDATTPRRNGLMGGGLVQKRDNQLKCHFEEIVTLEASVDEQLVLYSKLTTIYATANIHYLFTRC